jgi:BirA family transcriptional regulator, biotin operon repressor / biotin---[acetyl-CoA-carboxylase] ligase
VSGVGGRESGVGPGAPRSARRVSGSLSDPLTPHGASGPARLPADLTESLADLTKRRPNLALDLRWYASLPSTMDAVSAAAERGAAAGLVVVADEQVAGRGRRGRAWSSPPGAGLYFSYLARPARGFEVLTLAAGVAVRAGILEATGLAADLKWPNDLLVDGRKLAGLLAEAARVGTPEASVAIGVGVNLRPAAYPADVAMRATSIEAALGRAVDRGAVLAAVLEHLADTLAALEAGDAGAILHAWRAASPSGVGTPVEWSDPSGPRRGVTAGIDDRGALLVRTPAGTERIIAGELQWQLRR